jgi:hypothetical protein
VEVKELDVAEKVARCKVLQRFADGSTRQLWIGFIKEAGTWKISSVGTLQAEHRFQEYVVRVLYIYGGGEPLGLSPRERVIEIVKGGHLEGFSNDLMRRNLR